VPLGVKMPFRMTTPTSARHAAGRHPPDPEEHHARPGYPPRPEERQDHRHQLAAILAGGRVLGALRQGGVQVSGWADASLQVLPCPARRATGCLRCPASKRVDVDHNRRDQRARHHTGICDVGSTRRGEFALRPFLLRTSRLRCLRPEQVDEIVLRPPVDVSEAVSVTNEMRVGENDRRTQV